MIIKKLLNLKKYLKFVKRILDLKDELHLYFFNDSNL